MNIDDDTASESSIGLPPDFSLSGLLQSIESFIELYDEHKGDLQSTADQFPRLATTVKNMTEETRKNGKIAAITGFVMGCVLCIITSSVRWFAASVVVAGVMIVVGIVCYFIQSYSCIFNCLLKKVIDEKSDKEMLQNVGQEFQLEVEPLLSKIQEILNYMTNLQKCADTESPICSTPDKALKTISDVKKYKHNLAKLYENSQRLLVEFEEGFGIFVAVLDVMFYENDPNRDVTRELLGAVVKCASICEKTIVNLGSMKNDCDYLSLSLKP